MVSAQITYEPYSFANFAGQPGVAGNVNGTGSGALFDDPIGVAVDSAGNVYVGDANNDEIRKITPAGVVSILAGHLVIGDYGEEGGFTNGAGSVARFNYPHGVAVDSAGNVYVADYWNHAIRKITPAGMVSTLSTNVWSPFGVAVDSAGNVYVVEDCNTISKVTPAGATTIIAGTRWHPGTVDGGADGVGSTAQFNGPWGVAVDSAGNVFVADYGNHTIRKITPVGASWEVKTIAGIAGQSGSADGTGSAARFYNPAGVAADGHGNVFVADYGNHTIRKVTPAGVVTTVAGDPNNFGDTDGMGSGALFTCPTSVAVDSAGNLFVTDRCSSRIAKGVPGEPPFLARPGSPRDYPYTAFDTEESPPKRVGLPEYRVNTSSLNLVLEGSLFYMPTLSLPVNLRLVYNSAATPNGATTIGLFGKNWRFRYEAAIGVSGNNVLVTTGGGRPWMFTTPAGQALSTASPAHPMTLVPPAGMFDELKFYGPGQYFELREKDSKITHRYGVSGGTGNSIWRLTRLTDRSGNQLNLTVDGPTGRISSITDPANRLVSFTYDTTRNLCTGITVPDGRHIALAYDANKNLISITDMAGYIGTYTYDSLGFLTGIVTAGRHASFTYAKRPGADALVGDKIVASVTNAKGQLTSYALLPGNVGVQRTDPKGGITVFNGAPAGQTAKVADPLGNIRQMNYNDAQLPAAFTDADGKLTTFEYDDHGNLVQTVDALGHTTTLTYDTHDNLVSRLDALSQTWNYAYDDHDRVTSVETPLHNTTQFTYLGNGRLSFQHDARGNVTAFEYDIYGNLTKVTDPLTKSIQLAYDANGLRCTSLTDQRGKIKTMQYDNDDRLTLLKYDSVGGSLQPQRVNVFDAFGQTSLTDELGKITTVTRNEFGYITSVTDPLGNHTATDYDPNNNPTSVTDALGHITTTTYDAADRPLVFTDALGKMVHRAYDANGNLLTLTDKQTNQTAFQYDANNRLVQTKDPLNHTVTNSRDALGRVTTLANARGTAVLYTYDADGRLLKKEYKDIGGTVVPEAVFTYDPNGNVLSRNDDWGVTTYTYDTRNQPTAILYPTAQGVALTYTDGGQIASITYPNGMLVSYTYDDYNRLAIPSNFRNAAGTELQGNSERPNNVTRIVLIKGGTNTIDFAYDKAGNRVSATRPNNVSSMYLYDNAQRVTNILHQTGINLLWQCSLGYNGLCSVTQEMVSGSAKIVPGLPTAVTGAYYNACNQIASRDGRTYSYDADGNLTGIGISNEVFAAAYTQENRPSEITRLRDGVTETIRYTYDANGLRVKREVVGGAIVQYHYGPGDRLLFTTDGAGAITASYIWDGPTLFAILTGSSVNTDLCYVHLDRLGNVRAITDSSGAVKVKYAYQPYGLTDRETVPAGAADINPFTFVGGSGVQDEGGGLFYMKNRFYDSLTGRFLQRDPIGFKGGINLYAYVEGNPINRSDPTGLWDLIPHPNSPTASLFDKTGRQWNRSGVQPTLDPVTQDKAVDSVVNWLKYGNFIQAWRDYSNDKRGAAVEDFVMGVIGLNPEFSLAINILGQAEILNVVPTVKDTVTESAKQGASLCDTWDQAMNDTMMGAP